ncbi:hypothetical protein ACEYW6_32060 [Nostoc sp. UIC 10607]
MKRLDYRNSDRSYSIVTAILFLPNVCANASAIGERRELCIQTNTTFFIIPPPLFVLSESPEAAFASGNTLE